MEKDIADSNPPLPLDKRKSVASEAIDRKQIEKLSKMRSAYKGLSKQDIITRADEAIKQHIKPIIFICTL